MDDTSLVTVAVAPETMVISAIIEATPMIIPSMVKNDRILLLTIFSNAILRLSLIIVNPLTEITINDAHDTAAVFCHIRIMGDHHNGFSFIEQLLKKRQNLTACLLIQCSCWL